MEFDPLGTRLPIKIDTASNGEFAPRALTALQHAANACARERVGTAAKRTGLGRRDFIFQQILSLTAFSMANRLFRRWFILNF